MMAGEPYTFRELLMMFADSKPNLIRLNMIFATSHGDMVRQVEAALDWIGQEHSKTRQYRQDRDEDGLTIDVITDLRAMGFDASHDTAYGGHCDIVIEAKDGFLWLGEAKIHSSYDWLLKGFQQLDTRYSTGAPGQDTGGMLIYCKVARIDKTMKRWHAHLVANRPDVTIEICEDNPLALRSTHVHEATGRLFKVRHVPISLYFSPRD